MLYAAPGASRPKRLQGVFVDDREVKDVVNFLIEQKRELGAEDLDEDFGSREGDAEEGVSETEDSDVDFSSMGDDPSDQDELYTEAKQLVIESGRAATTYLQRRLSIGYGRAAKLLDILEEEGVVGPAEGRNKGRVVLVGKAAGEAGDAEYDDPMRDQAARDKWQV
jgi:S-DNA-T family DNA segregation ATPase FtsK/SpoIIIE